MNQNCIKSIGEWQIYLLFKPKEADMLEILIVDIIVLPKNLIHILENLVNPPIRVQGLNCKFGSYPTTYWMNICITDFLQQTKPDICTGYLLYYKSLYI